MALLLKIVLSVFGSGICFQEIFDGGEFQGNFVKPGSGVLMFEM